MAFTKTIKKRLWKKWLKKSLAQFMEDGPGGLSQKTYNYVLSETRRRIKNPSYKEFRREMCESIRTHVK